MPQYSKALWRCYAFFFASCGVLMACGGAGDDRIYTLYRASPSDASIRTHIATFDADEKENYNRENCETAGKLFQSQPGVTVKYWCEKGRFRT